MSAAENGGPAFPRTGVLMQDEQTGRRVIRLASDGMTLRDYFAAEALPEAIARELGPLGSYQHFCDGSADIMANAAYMVADAMLRARERQA